jgi:hypothetical protein
MEASEAGVAAVYFSSQHQRCVCYMCAGSALECAHISRHTRERGLEKHMAGLCSRRFHWFFRCLIWPSTFMTPARARATPRRLPLDTHPQSRCKFPHACMLCYIVWAHRLYYVHRLAQAFGRGLAGSRPWLICPERARLDFHFAPSPPHRVGLFLTWACFATHHLYE